MEYLIEYPYFREDPGIWDGGWVILKKGQRLLLPIPNPVRISVTIPMRIITGTPAVVVGGGVDSVGIVVCCVVGSVGRSGVCVGVDATSEKDDVATAFGTVTPVTVTR